jgi:hypothetical protein
MVFGDLDGVLAGCFLSMGISFDVVWVLGPDALALWLSRFDPIMIFILSEPKLYYEPSTLL